MIKVYQREELGVILGFDIDKFLKGEVENLPEMVREDYKLVALVDSESFEHAFEKTNTISCSWWKNPEVTPQFDGSGCRSTSVGDVMEAEDGTFLLVANIGFVEFKWDAELRDEREGADDFVNDSCLLSMES